VNLQIVRGDASPEEIAALVAVLTARARRVAAAEARAAGAGGAAERSASGPGPWRGTGRRAAWADRSRGLRAPLTHGHGAWRASARPR
jgi:acyl-CoA carboxylase epsilon subunit